MAWTKEQQLAIDQEGTNIIVSAGAGSGKTAVLTERVVRKLKQGIDINKLLVLTFTKEAANEMKLRIRRAIEKEEKIKNQLDYIDQAYITTFDSYALSIVKKYNYLLNIPKNINIIDSSIVNIKKEKIIDDIFNEYYEKNDSRFNKIIEDFCIKDDNQIKSSILKISNSLDLKIDKKDYLNKYLENYYNNDNIDNLVDKYLNIINTKKKELEDILLEISYYDNEYFLKLKENMNSFIESKNYEDIKNEIEFEIPKLKNGSSDELKNVKENFTKLIKEIKELVKYKDINQIKDYINNTKDYVSVIIDIIKELDEQINKYKETNNTYEFVDIAKMAINIVKDNELVKNELKYYYNEIMLDEYQDTNDLQEEFISLISNNNVYMVGDIKQSIYRFRNANPTIFKEKYENYSALNNGIKIDLLKNFRSRKEVLDGINIIFNSVMDLSLGGADYKKTHQMVFGNNNYILDGNDKENNELEIYNYDLEDKTYSKEEKEIFIIAKDIKEKMNSNYQVFDKDTSKLRNITYSDFCIIMDRGTEFEKYKKIFEHLSIPLTVYKDENLTNDDITSIIKNIIGLIIKIKENNLDQEFKYFYISISRSFLIEKKDQEIFDVFKNNTFKTTELYNTLNEITEEIKNINLPRALELIINKFNIYNNLIKIGDINKNIIKLEQLLNISKNLNDLGYDINDFYNYLLDMLNEEQEIKYSLSTDKKDSVKIMNIHKSKGLEFPICYFSGLHKPFNKSDIKERFLYSNTYGIITPVFDEGITDTIIKTLLKEETNIEEISEKIRLFYVALTRAREKIIIVTSLDLNNALESEIVNNNIRKKYNSFLDILNSVTPILQDKIKNIDLNSVGLNKDYEKLKTYNYKNEIHNNSTKINYINIEIPNEKKEQKKYSKQQIKLNTKDEIENMKKGIEVHYILENDDFFNPKNDITKKFIKHIDLNNCNIYKEYEFINETIDEESHGIIDLILEYEKEITIIDYKLKNIKDNEYLKQLNGYKKYIEEKTKKKVSIYLYSILDDNLEKLD